MSEKKLRQSIKDVLGNVTEKSSPMVFEAIQSEMGYRNIEEMVINMMIDEGMTPSATIPHIERLL